MAEKSILITKEGKEDLQKKLEQKKGPIRQEIIKRIDAARAQGDLSENSEYDEAKEAQRNNESDIAELEYILDNCTIVEDDGNDGTVKFGHAVRVHDCEENEDVIFTIVGTYQSDPRKHLVSNESPVGKALLGHKKDDKVKVETLDGDQEYIILEVF